MSSLEDDRATRRTTVNCARSRPRFSAPSNAGPVGAASAIRRSESGNRSIKALLTLAFGLIAACAGRGQEKPIEAWWLNATFTPSQTAYESLPVKDINPNWVRISVLTYASLPPDAKPDFPWMRRDGFVFQVDDYFKRSTGVADRELCGVFEDQAGHQGRFLLVLQRIGASAWKVAFLHQQAGETGFSVFARKAGGLYWGTCMQCGEFSRLQVKKGKFHIEAAP
jgi:hypothetical protein